MPNYVQNKLTFECPLVRARQIMKEIAFDSSKSGSEDDYSVGTFDFAKVVPMPESLSIEEGSNTTRAIETFLTARNPENPIYFGVKKMEAYEFQNLVGLLNSESMFSSHKTDIELSSMTEAEFSEKDALGAQAVDNMQKYGATTWYHWRINNWGTKWNSFGAYKDAADDGELIFQTAWDAPLPIIEKLSEKYPDVEFVIYYADEDIGRNFGYARFFNGELLEDVYEPGDTLEECIRFACDIWGYDPEEYLEGIED